MAKTSRIGGQHKISPRVQAGNAYSALAGDPEVVLVGGGRRAYLWLGGSINGCFGTISGPKTLRQLALAILEEVGND